MLLGVHISFENYFDFGYVLEELGHQGAFLITRRREFHAFAVKKNLLTPKLKALVLSYILTKFVVFFIALYLEKQMEPFCCGNRASPDFSTSSIMISWDSFSSHLYCHTNNTYYSNKSHNRKRFCCGKVVNFGSWAELLSARHHPGLVEVVNAWLKLTHWYWRCLKEYFEPGVVQRCEVVNLQVCVPQTLVKHLYLWMQSANSAKWGF